ncbi:MAG: hypothetical protein Q8S57_03210 [Methanoregula sp.]|nr:hypothetical protein [Methanoregula sp.]
MASDKFRPYLDHPFVQSIPDSVLDVLDTPELNDVIRVEDQIIRSVREYYLDDQIQPKRLTPGQFSGAVLLARGLAFLDVAHHKKDLIEIANDVWRITPTTAARPSFNHNLKTSVIPRLKDGFIEFEPSSSRVINVIPYPIGSKLFVKKNFLEIGPLFEQQINQFEIVRGVLNFPQLTSELEAASTKRYQFLRDYVALQEIDAVRPQDIKGSEYTFSKSFITGAQSKETWESVLDTSSELRIGIRQLMEFIGDSGGFISHPEIVRATSLPPRIVNQMIRTIDNVGIAHRTYTLEMESALSRPTSGTLIAMNYQELDNAQSILTLMRSVPETNEVLYRLTKESSLSEDDLSGEFGVTPAQKIINSLEIIGLIDKEARYDGRVQLVPFKGNQKFLEDVLAVAANSRHVIDPEYDLTEKLKPAFEKFDPQRFEKEAKQMRLDFFERVEEKIT